MIHYSGRKGDDENENEVLRGKARLPLHLELRNHSPTGFAWGYGGSGPAQLALALCYDVLGDVERALAVYQDVKWRVVARWPMDEGWTITSAELQETIDAIEAEQAQRRQPPAGSDEGGDQGALG